MQSKQPYDAPRVHVRALARLQQLHEEISAGHCPSIQDLAVSTKLNAREIPSDLLVKMPLMPQGVEHEPTKRQAFITHMVKMPLMLQGVEHGQQPRKACCCALSG